MLVTVRLFATLRDGRFKEQKLDLPENSTPDELIAKFSIQPGEIAICLINGRHANLHDPLHHGDTISLFPPVGGG